MWMWSPYSAQYRLKEDNWWKNKEYNPKEEMDWVSKDVHQNVFLVMEENLVDWRILNKLSFCDEWPFWENITVSGECAAILEHTIYVNLTSDDGQCSGKYITSTFEYWQTEQSEGIESSFSHFL